MMADTEVTIPVVTMDGPSASGKGTVSALLANKLGWHYLDSGALYRAVSLYAMEQSLTLEHKQQIMAVAKQLEIRFLPQNGASPQIINRGQDISDLIRVESCGVFASQLAANADIRQVLLKKQQAYRVDPGLVADGRDMGTVVFPDAMLKMFVTASPEVRAERRYKQLKEKGLNVNLPHLVGEIAARDARDASRKVSPLMPADDACILDTSQMAIDDVVAAVYRLVKEKLKSSGA